MSSNLDLPICFVLFSDEFDQQSFYFPIYILQYHIIFRITKTLINSIIPFLIFFFVRYTTPPYKFSILIHIIRPISFRVCETRMKKQYFIKDVSKHIHVQIHNIHTRSTFITSYVLYSLIH